MLIKYNDFKKNIEKYLRFIELEDIVIEKDDQKLARIIKYSENDDFKVRERLLVQKSQTMEISYEDFRKISRDSAKHYEYIDGKIYLLSAPGYRHQKIVREIMSVFINYFQHKSCEPLTSPFDLKLYKNNEINIVQPDILVICDQENINDNDRYEGVPELTIEVLSSSTKNVDLLKKLNLYMMSGVKEYWIVNPFTEELLVYEFTDKKIASIKSFRKNEIVKSNIFSDLKVKLSHIFA